MVETVLRDRKPLGFLVCSLLVLLILMSYQVTDVITGRTVLGNVLFQIFSPLQDGIMFTLRGSAGGLSNYFNIVNTNKENQQLRKEVSQLKIQIETTAQQKQENDRLRQILELRQKLPYQQIAGEVIGQDAKAISSTVSVNRGSTEGIRIEMPVVTALGVVGMTIQVTPWTSKVQLITDSASAIGGMLQRSQVSGIVAGTGSDRCVLRYLPVTSDVKAGDVVVTSGLDGIFPAGMPLGTVAGLINESDLYKSANITLYQEFSSLREVVFLLKSNNPQTVPAAQKQKSPQMP